MGAKHTKPASQETNSPPIFSSSTSSSNSFKSKFEEYEGEKPRPKKQYITPSARHDLDRLFFD
jgi:hypothetical protein